MTGEYLPLPLLQRGSLLTFWPLWDEDIPGYGCSVQLYFFGVWYKQGAYLCRDDSVCLDLQRSRRIFLL